MIKKQFIVELNQLSFGIFDVLHKFNLQSKFIKDKISYCLDI